MDLVVWEALEAKVEVVGAVIPLELLLWAKHLPHRGSASHWEWLGLEVLART